jgi:hypothetical protein
MAELRLRKLPERTPVKITILVSPELHEGLADYARFYAEAYGAEEPIPDLISAMLEAFLASDPAFVRRRRAGA